MGKIIEVPLGGKLVIERAGKGVKPAPKDTPGEARNGVITSAYPEEEVIRRKGEAIFFDLGTRYDADTDTYLYLEFPVKVATDSIEALEKLQEYRDELSALLLSDNPLGTTDGHTNCRKLPQEAEYLYVDALFKREGEDPKRYVLGQGGMRSLVKDLRTGLPIEDTSKWKGAALRTGLSGSYQLGVESAWFYNAFDTSISPLFKVTETPDFDAPGIAFAVGTTKLEVYLTPRYGWVVDSILDGEGEVITETYYVVRLPVLPDFTPASAPIEDIAELFPDNPYYIRGTINAGLSAALTAYAIDIGSPIDPATQFPLPAQFQAGEFHQPVLVAIIKQGDTPYYIWEDMEGQELIYIYAGTRLEAAP